MILTAIFAKDVGLVYGNTEVFTAHLIAVVLVVAFTLAMSFVLYKVVDLMMPLRVRIDQEERGLDNSQHGEEMLSH